MAKPFVKWAGGKGKLIPQLVTMLPPDWYFRKINYVEPFVGGGAMLLYVLKRFPNVQHAVINDINPHLVNAYRVIKERPRELVSVLSQMQNSYLQNSDEEQRKASFLNVRDTFNQGNLTDVQDAACLLFLNKTCFNGLYRENSRGKFNVPFGKYVNPLICDEQTIMEDSELLQRVEILNGDYQSTLDCIDDYTFFYFDPPYRPLSTTSNFNSYASGGFDDDEQRRLKAFCDEITSRGCQFMLSNADCSAVNPQDDFFEKLYSDYEIHRVLAARSINSKPDRRGKITELLICNYKQESFLTYAAEEPVEYQKLK